MIRQGDVLMIPVTAIPPTAKAIPAKQGAPLTVALGEVTGHGHGWDADSGVALMEAPDGTVYIDNPRMAPLVHGQVNADRIATLPVVEHSPLPAPRRAEYRPQVEYAEQDVRQVMD